MEAKEYPCLKILSGPHQFQIPIYQRAYSWTRPQCRQLWDDLVRTGSDEGVRSHFIGSIVYIGAGGHHTSAVEELQVIDGQQRLTTLTLLLLALVAEAEERQAKGEAFDFGADAGNIRHYYLLNDREQGRLRHKLSLTYGDRQSLGRLLNGESLEGPGLTVSTRIRDNWLWFRKKLGGLDEAGAAALWSGLSKLMMISVILDREKDDPQLIFESLNSTGLELSQADLIRNHVLIGLPPEEQRQLFEAHWRPMELTFGADAYAAHFDRFVRHYLTMKRRDIPNIRNIYGTFKQHLVRSGDTAATVAELHRYSGMYARIVLGHEEHPKLRAAFDSLTDLRVDTAVPFLLEVVADLDDGCIGPKEALEVLLLIEAYVVRRTLSDFATNTLNKTFMTLGDTLDKSSTDAYVESLGIALLSLPGSRAFPRDEMLRERLKSKDIYALKTRNHLFDHLENHGRKEPVATAEYTFEHILPQSRNLSVEWREALGDDWFAARERVLHTLGNLTLTGYNSELSDRPFEEKRDHSGHGFTKSPLRLNEIPAAAERWDEAAIRDRTRVLTEKIIAIWPTPDVELPLLEPEEPTVHDLADHPNLVGPLKDAYEELHDCVLELLPGVRRKIKKVSIGYYHGSPVLDVVVLKKHLNVCLSAPKHVLHDPHQLVQDFRGRGHVGNGDSLVRFRPGDPFEPVLDLIRKTADYVAAEEVHRKR